MKKYNWIMKTYKAILWFFGFKSGEYITYMLKRSELRLGFFWWAMFSVITSLLTWVLHTYLGELWFIFALYPLNMLVLLLIWHVAYTKNVERKK